MCFFEVMLLAVIALAGIFASASALKFTL